MVDHPPGRKTEIAIMPQPEFSRRAFLAAGVAAGGGLVVGGVLAGSVAEAEAAVAVANGGSGLNAWITLGADGSVVLTIPRVEMGQGTYTSLSQLAAEELDVAWDAVRVAHAPVDRAFANMGIFWDGGGEPPGPLLRGLGSRLVGMQLTGGSTAIRDGWTMLRPAGAAARAMLVEEAAARWGVAAADCTTRLGAVIHRTSGNSASYSELAEAAALRKPPRDPALRDPSTFRLVGTSPPRPDTPPKVNGTAGFGIDVRLPGMLVAAIRHAPSFGGSVANFDRAAIESRPGVVRAVEVKDAVAVVADGFWRANTTLTAGEEAGELTFAAGAAGTLDNDAVFARLDADLAENRGTDIETEGDLGLAMSVAGARVIDAEYRVPFLAHATMEPMNCTARVSDGTCEVWLGTQAPDFVREAAAKAAGTSERNTVVHTQYLGGGFGRRSEPDLAAEAAAIARELPGIPVKLVWSREEDMRHDFYRPAAMARMAGAVYPPNGVITAWRALVASAPMLAGYLRRNMGFPFGSLAALAADRFEVRDAVKPLYPIANRQIAWTASETPVPTGNWRSVSNSFGAFFSESFLDELAAEMEVDPFALRRRMLASKPRHLAVLDLAAEQAGWGEPLGENQGRGIAIHESFGTIVAQVVEVTAPPEGWVQVDRVVSAIDVGFPVNPEGLRAQVESAVVYGLSAALYGDVTLDGGAVREANFDQVEVMRMPDAPRMETHIAPAGGPIGGGGEPGVPPVAPALTNAVFAATGRRIRSLPLRAHGLA